MKNVSIIMGKMTARNIAKNFLQYLSMIIITMLAVTLFCGFISNSATLNNTLQEFYKNSNLTDLICQYSVITKEDKDFLQSLNADGLEYRIYTEGSIDKQSAKIYISKPDNTISLPLISQGERGVLIDKHVSERDNIKIGDILPLELQIPALPQRTTLNLEVTGIMNFPEVANTTSYSPVYIDSDKFFSETFLKEYIRLLFPALTDEILDSIITKDLIQTVFDDYCTQALIKTNLSTLKNEINNHYANLENPNLIFVSDRDSMESVVMLNNEISQSLKMIYVFPVIFMLVSMLVILSTIGPLILKERTNIGTLKSLGIPNRRILMYYSLFGVVLCFIGSVLGTILGPLIIPNVLLIKYGLIYSIPAFTRTVFSPLWSAVAVLSMCALAALIGFAVCRKTSLEKPAACMRPLPPKENFILNKTSAKTVKTKKRNIPFKMAARNIIVKPSRALMTLVGVAGCVALLVCSFGIGDTVNNSIDFELGKQFKYDISTSYAKESQESFINAVDALKADGKIDVYETYKTFYMSAKGGQIKDVKVFALPDTPALTTINPDGKTLITKSIAEDLKINKGDKLTLSAGGNSYSLFIDEIIETSFTKGVFVNDTGIFDENYHTLNMWIKAENPETLIDYINSVNGTKNADTMGNLRADVNTTISSIQTIKLTMMVFSIALAVVVLYNLSLLNIKERNRDIATMKVLGFSTGDIVRSLLYEMLILVTAGTLLGLLLGYPITVLVMSINRIEVLTFIYYIKPVSFVISALISVATALIINILFVRPVRKINMTESLKSVE